jgi:hypothetical protein
MAITPRSFLLNPRLLLGVAALFFAGAAFLLYTPSTSSVGKASWNAVAHNDCSPTFADQEYWSVDAWEANIHCLMDQDEGEAAYRAARTALRYHPRSETLLNLKGFVAGRNGDHAIAAYDFREGLRLTGSPSGVFENNIAWTMLWQLEPLEAARAERVLRQSRALYTESLTKGWSCERVHTGMFVEYAIASLAARTSEDGRNDPRVREAVRRYDTLHADYRPCARRLRFGDELVVEEVLSAAVVDQEMGYMAGLRRPSRHLRLFDDAVEIAGRIGMRTGDLCDRSIPVPEAVPACEALMR